MIASLIYLVVYILVVGLILWLLNHLIDNVPPGSSLGFWPLTPCMLMSERIRINAHPRHHWMSLRALSADCAKSFLKRPSRMSL